MMSGCFNQLKTQSNGISPRNPLICPSSFSYLYTCTWLLSVFARRMRSPSAPWASGRRSGSPSSTTHHGTPPSSAGRPASCCASSSGNSRACGRWAESSATGRNQRDLSVSTRSTRGFPPWKVAPSSRFQNTFIFFLIVPSTSRGLQIIAAALRSTYWMHTSGETHCVCVCLCETIHISVPVVNTVWLLLLEPAGAWSSRTTAIRIECVSCSCQKCRFCLCQCRKWSVQEHWQGKTQSKSVLMYLLLVLSNYINKCQRWS